MSVNPLFGKAIILIKGAGDLASGVAFRLKRSGFPIIMTELPAPSLIRRTVSFGEAVYSQTITVEGITAQRVGTVKEAQRLAQSDQIPILVDLETKAVKQLNPPVLVDAIMAKTNTGSRLDDAPLVVALGPGFTAGLDCHAVIETNRGHSLGRVIYHGSAEADTKTPGNVEGHAHDRVLRSPADGYVENVAHIGDSAAQNQLIAQVGDHEIRAPFDGVLRGLIHPSVRVTRGLKIGDLDPRGKVAHCFTMSDKSLAIGGGVLEAVLASEPVRLLLQTNRHPRRL